MFKRELHQKNGETPRSTELRKLTDCLRRFRARSSLSGVGDACETLRLSISQGILWFEVSSGYIYQRKKRDRKFATGRRLVRRAFFSFSFPFSIFFYTSNDL